MDTWKVWDAVDYLESEDAIAAFLEAAFEDSDPRVIAACLADVARARARLGTPPAEVSHADLGRAAEAFRARGLALVPADSLEERAAAE